VSPHKICELVCVGAGNVIGSESALPPDWKKVLDASSELYYYWNTVTNETSWEKPAPLSGASTVTDTHANKIELSDVDTLNKLPSGWTQMVHAATKQVYYIHGATGERRATLPSDNNTVEVISSTNGKGPSTALKRTAQSNENNKKRRIVVDPLDPTGGMVSCLNEWTLPFLIIPSVISLQ